MESIISRNLKRARIQKGMKQSFVADELDIDRSNYARIENRGNKMTIEQLENICKVIDVSVVEILDPNYMAVNISRTRATPKPSKNVKITKEEVWEFIMNLREFKVYQLNKQLNQLQQ